VLWILLNNAIHRKDENLNFEARQMLQHYAVKEILSHATVLISRIQLQHTKSKIFPMLAN